jgi:hypothetical protein
LIVTWKVVSKGFRERQINGNERAHALNVLVVYLPLLNWLGTSFYPLKKRVTPPFIFWMYDSTLQFSWFSLIKKWKLRKNVNCCLVVQKVPSCFLFSYFSIFVFSPRYCSVRVDVVVVSVSNVLIGSWYNRIHWIFP